MINLLSESAYIAQTNKIKYAITNKVNEIKNTLNRIETKLGAEINWLDDVETTLETELTAINTELTDKGSTQADDFSEVAEKISDIQTGITPTGQINITANGIYDVTDYASASVQIQGIDIEETTVTFETASNQLIVYNPNDKKPLGITIKQTSYPEGTVARTIYACLFLDGRTNISVIGGIDGYNASGNFAYNSLDSTRPGNYAGYASYNLTTGRFLIQNPIGAWIGTYEVTFFYELES